MKAISIGVDIGGSHITCRQYNLQSSTLVEAPVVRLPVDGNGTKDSILDSWAEAIRKSIATINILELAGIGFAMPGPFDYKKGIAWFDAQVGKFHHLHGVDVQTQLRERIDLPAEVPIRFVNDAAAFAIGEANIEAVSTYNRILVLTLGTGFGSTFIDSGMPVAGKYGVPEDGFLYHVPFKEGIADEYFSTRWFLGEYRRVTGKAVNGVKYLVDVHDSDSLAQELFTRFGSNLGSFLVPWIKTFNAECIILGGNISKSLPLFIADLEKELHAENIDLEIRLSGLDENAAIIGSARLFETDN